MQAGEHAVLFGLFEVHAAHRQEDAEGVPSPPVRTVCTGVKNIFGRTEECLADQGLKHAVRVRRQRAENFDHYSVYEARVVSNNECEQETPAGCETCQLWHVASGPAQTQGGWVVA